MSDPPSTAVLCVGYDLPELLSGAPGVHTFPEALGRDDLAAVSDAIEVSLQRCGHALVIYPTWLGEATLPRLETVRAALASGCLALRGSSLPPLAGGVLCNVAAALTAHLTRPGQLVAALEEVERELVVAAWVASVTGLTSPSPSLLQHLGSWWPGSSYAVLVQPEPAVLRAGAGADLPLQKPQRPTELVVAAQEDFDAWWLTDTIGRALGGLRTRTVPATRHGPRWWGTERLIEAVAFPTAVAELAAELAARHRLRLCGWCSKAIASTQCPFCRGVDQPGPTTAAVDQQASGAT